MNDGLDDIGDLENNFLGFVVHDVYKCVCGGGRLMEEGRNCGSESVLCFRPTVDF